MNADLGQININLPASNAVCVANLLLFVLATVGMCHIVVESSIAEGFRQWVKKTFPEKVSKVVECYQCFGFWSGVVMALFVLPFGPFTLLAGGCAGSFVSVWAASYLNTLEAQSTVVPNHGR